MSTSTGWAAVQQGYVMNPGGLPNACHQGWEVGFLLGLPVACCEGGLQSVSIVFRSGLVLSEDN